ncbi:MAG: hypothetical protein NTW61_01700 [Candidatus Melainabacteria bacterium]|nr:hypothetical protein [Candidatus Melainabacteria bacterium]
MMMMGSNPQQGKPNQGRFEQYLGMKYAKELQDIQQRFGPAHQSSHSLKDADFMLGHLVTAGINNLAGVVLQAKQAKAIEQAHQALIPIPVESGEAQAMQQPPNAYTQNQQAHPSSYGSYRHYKK